MSKKFKSDKLGLEVEIGKFACQANGSAWIRSGNNIVLSTATASKEAREFMGFFPLTVEYRERMSAAGKFPGGFIKREGRLSDFEILSSRVIDRPLRPLFPKYYFNEVQLLSNVLSSDGVFPTSILALIGSSLSLIISDIPFSEPVGAVSVGRINGEIVFNFGHEDKKESDVNMIVAGTKNGIAMVEGHCGNLSEEELVDLLFKAHEQIKLQVEWQLEIQKEVGKTKLPVTSNFDWNEWHKKVSDALPKDFVSAYFIPGKHDRNEAVDKIKKEAFSKFENDLSEGKVTDSKLSFLFEEVVKENLPDSIISKDKRIDGRDFNTVRPLTMETSLLPQVHGSSMFRRGETQALVTVTLGTGQDAQKVEPLIGDLIEKSFLLHYNFPPFCTGEVKPMRGVSRREIGHGYLAEKSFDTVLPSRESFPYTIRIISDVLESNGSSSMATVCGTTLALMDAGVPIREMVGGVAMGLIKDSSDNFQVLTDILGTEDALGLMDFKITGTEKSITAVQMDIKIKGGLTRDILSKALAQARDARLHILKEMKTVLAAPRSEISSLAPRISTMKIAPDKIGLIIGPGGKTIKNIILQTGVEIDIDDDGIVKIFSKDGESAEKAKGIIKALSGDIDVGSTFKGKIVKVFDYGLLVELVPGKAGLVHISAIPRSYQDDLNGSFKIDSDIVVKVVDVDQRTGRVKLVAPELKK
ncbi:polyribonucleotide nucleotidyltransferase [Candidatus Babeliales bacterium]|nr:polyribonucleotide nucleotidyltransferase [Candidatus Babeliales bacterium]